MATARKRTVLNMQQRLNVLKDVQEATLTTVQIAVKYGVATKTVHRITQNAVKINAFAGKSERAKRRRKMIEPKYKKLDEELLAWYEERRSLGHRVTDALMLEKATELKENIPSDSRSLVSRGWLLNFKVRHGIRLRNGHGEEAGLDKDAAETFVMDFKRMIEEEKISLEHVYNMDESGLTWKALPSKTRAGEEGRNVSGAAKKDRVTIALCANATGSHKMKPLVIYKYKNPRALKHQRSLSVILKSQKEARMTREIFLNWFENHFKPSARKHREELGNYGKIILLIDSREAHEISIKEDEDVKIIYFPANTTSLLQPFDQGIIESTKRIFRRRLLQRALSFDGGVNEFYANYTLKDFINYLWCSWADITQTEITNAWSKIVHPGSTSVQPVKMEPDWEDMMSVFTGEKCTEAHVTEFLTECEKAERRNEAEEAEEEESEAPNEPAEGPAEFMFEGSNDPAIRSELSKAFETITFFGARAPTYIQQIAQGLKTYFLGEEH